MVLQMNPNVGKRLEAVGSHIVVIQKRNDCGQASPGRKDVPESEIRIRKEWLSSNRLEAVGSLIDLRVLDRLHSDEYLCTNVYRSKLTFSKNDAFLCPFMPFLTVILKAKA